MALGKTIRLYLTDGSPAGPILAEIMNWTGQVLVVPRTHLYELAKRDELRRTGVYVLVGQDLQLGSDRVYIGEADDVYERLKAHDRDESKDFWTRAVAITSKDFNLTKAHGRHLESRMIELALNAGRAAVSNSNSPALKTLPESDLADMEYFLEQMRLILPVLGFDFLRPPATQEHAVDAKALPRFVMSDVGTSATAQEIDGRFVVLRGSTARRQGTPSWGSYTSLRDELLAQGKLVVKDDEFYEFAEDVEFNSPSAAAAVIAAARRSGRVSWKLPDGRTYAEWKESQMDNAEA
jgi:hypothetical protein